MRPVTCYCPNDHELSGSNLMIEYRNGNRIQRCRICRSEQSKRSYQERVRKAVMVRKHEKTNMLIVLGSFARCRIGMFNTWTVDETRYGVWLYSGWHVLDDAGGFIGHASVSLFFRWDETLDAFKLHFRGKKSAYLNKKYGLREPMENVITEFLRSQCRSMGLPTMWSGKEQKSA